MLAVCFVTFSLSTNRRFCVSLLDCQQPVNQFGGLTGAGGGASGDCGGAIGVGGGAMGAGGGAVGSSGGALGNGGRPKQASREPSVTGSQVYRVVPVQLIAAPLRVPIEVREFFQMTCTTSMDVYS